MEYNSPVKQNLGSVGDSKSLISSQHLTEDEKARLIDLEIKHKEAEVGFTKVGTWAMGAFGLVASMFVAEKVYKLGKTVISKVKEAKENRDLLPAPKKSNLADELKDPNAKPNLDFILDTFIPKGALVLLHSLYGGSKSTLLSQILWGAASGKATGLLAEVGTKSSPMCAILCDSENGEWEYQRRYHDKAEQCPPITIYHDFRFSDVASMSQTLRKSILDNPAINKDVVAGIDNITSAVRNLSANQVHELANELESIQKEAREKKGISVTFILVKHSAADSRAGNEVAGSIEWVNRFHYSYQLKPVEGLDEDKYKLLHVERARGMAKGPMVILRRDGWWLHKDEEQTKAFFAKRHSEGKSTVHQIETPTYTYASNVPDSVVEDWVRMHESGTSYGSLFNEYGAQYGLKNRDALIYLIKKAQGVVNADSHDIDEQ